ncbi:hypothetical protein PAMP_020814 [Pampus punctatissimus]
MNTIFAENGSSSHTTVVEYYQALSLVTISINIVLSLPLNGYVMWLILTGERGTLTSDIFSLNLAASEFIFSLSGMWYFFYTGLKVHLCFEAYMFFLGLLYTARPLFQCCICVECYVRVVHPVFFLRYKPLRYRVACCCVAWLISLVFCIYSKYTYSNTLYLYGFFIQNLLLFSVKLFCCLSVLCALKRPGPGEQEVERKRSNTIKIRAFKIMSLIMITMAINLFLYIVTIPVQCCLKYVEFANALTISVSLALATGFIQPLLYLQRNGKLNCLRKF